MNKKIVLCFLSLWLVLAQHALAQPAFVWERQKDFSGGFDLLRSVSTIGNTAVTAGNASVTGGLDLAILNYGSEGNLRWADQTPLMPGMNTNVFTVALGDLVFVAGYNSVVSNDSDIFVMAYNATIGKLLWHKILGKGRDDLPQGLAASPSAVVVVGYGGNTSTPPITALNALIRAYDPITGQMLWEDQIDKGDTIEDIAWTVCIEGDLVFVAGTTNALDADRNMMLRAYRVTTGELLWQVQRSGVSPAAIAAQSNRVFVAGSNGPNAYMAAFNARRGVLVWEDAATAGNFRDIQIQDQYLVGVGSSLQGSLVRAYHVANGKRQWQHITTPQPGFQQALSAVALSDDVAYVTGFSGRDFAYTEFLVRAYDLSKGRILFEDTSHRNPGSGAAGLDIAVSATKVYAVGWASDNGSADFLIRAYDRDATPPKRKLLTSTPKQHDEGVDPLRSPRTLASGSR